MSRRPGNHAYIPPTELLYKKAIVLAPGTFEVVEPAHGQMIRTTLASLPARAFRIGSRVARQLPDLDGVLLESVARLFRENVRLSVFPVPTQALEDGSALVGWKWKVTNGLVGARDIEPAEPLNHLYRYLVGSGFIVPKELPNA
jgi:hypothetical protein